MYFRLSLKLFYEISKINFLKSELYNISPKVSSAKLEFLFSCSGLGSLVVTYSAPGNCNTEVFRAFCLAWT